jgi:hypothetical protein
MSILDDIDILIPAFIDHKDRERNLNILLNYFDRIGVKNIYVNEHYKDYPKLKNLKVNYINRDITGNDYYNKMVCGNELYRDFSRNKIVCLYDIDVLIPKKSLIDCAEKLLNGYGFAYPYNGYFYDIPLYKVKEIEANKLVEINLTECTLFAKESHGGCVMFARECFEEAGMLNPLFKNVGFDDDEINVRFSRLGYKKYRSSAPLLHMTHHRGETTYNHSKYVNYNGDICHKVTTMDIEDLKKYVKQWNPYANS